MSEVIKTKSSDDSIENPRTNKRFWIGVLSTLVGGTLWGFSGSCAQFLLSNYDVDPLFVTSARMVMAGVLLLLFMLLKRRSLLFLMLKDRASRFRLAIFGFAILGCQATYIIAINYSNAGTVTVLQCTNIVFILIVTCLILRKLPKIKEVIGVVVALIATWLIATQGKWINMVLPPEAIFWGLMAGVTAAIYTMCPKKLFTKWGSFNSIAVGMMVGAIIVIIAHLILNVIGELILFPELDATGWIAIIAITLVGTIAAFGFFLHGVSIVGPVKGSLLGTIEPASATIISAIWLGTEFSIADIFGFILMMAMIVLVTIKGKDDERDVAQVVD